MTQLAITKTGGVDLDHLMRFADLVGKSGMFKASCPEEVATKILWGSSAGLDPVVSVQGIDIIQGSPAPSGGLIATVLERHPRYAYHVLRRDESRCDLAFYAGDIGPQGSPFNGSWVPGSKPWENLKPGVAFRGIESYTIEDAKRAGLTGKGPWKSYPRAMLYNRALSEGHRAFAADLFGGGKPYTPEELGAPPPREDTVVPPTTYIEAEFNVETPQVETEREIVASFNDPRQSPHHEVEDDGLIF